MRTLKLFGWLFLVELLIIFYYVLPTSIVGLVTVFFLAVITFILTFFAINWYAENVA